MPIYEFYCGPCHTIFSFLSRRVNTTTTPACPKCFKPLGKQVSSFATLRHNSGGDENDDMAGMDEARMERAMSEMGGEIEKLGDDSDPQEAASLMQRFAKASGLSFNETINEALGRMAAGEDADAVEAEFGEALESANPFAENAAQNIASLKRLLRASGPRRDPKLYDL
jgi:putative FmdB family regulatory protein